MREACKIGNIFCQEVKPSFSLGLHRLLQTADVSSAHSVPSSSFHCLFLAPIKNRDFIFKRWNFEQFMLFPCNLVPWVRKKSSNQYQTLSFLNYLQISLNFSFIKSIIYPCQVKRVHLTKSHFLVNPFLCFSLLKIKNDTALYKVPAGVQCIFYGG